MKILLIAFKILFLTLVLFYSCKPEKKWDCVKGTGKKVEQITYIEPFDSLFIEAFMTVYLIQDTANFIVMNAGINLLPKIDIFEENKSLYIKDRNYCNWVRSYKKSKITAEIHFKSMQKLVCRSASDIFSQDTLSMDTLIISIWSKLATVDVILNTKWCAIKLNSASGLYKIRGKTDINYIYSVGNGHIYTDELIAKKSYIYAASTGKISCNVSDVLDVEMYSSGNVYYVLPKPILKLDKKSYATGDVLPLE